MTIAAITGGREHHVRLSEADAVLAEARVLGVSIVRHGAARGVDSILSGYLARHGIKVEPWPISKSEWSEFGNRAGPARNRAMLVGSRDARASAQVGLPGLADVPTSNPADILFRLTGGAGTRDCEEQAGGLGIKVVSFPCGLEPAIINRHHYKGKNLPEPATYIGRGSPLGNPFPVSDHGADSYRLYRQWLWARLVAKDRLVLEALDKITARHHLVCSCWPKPCHGEIVVRAWRWHHAATR